MADTKLADLTALTTTSDDDLLYVVDDPAGTPADRKLALSDVFKRGTVTTSSPVIDAAQTWNDGAVTFTGFKLNITNNASVAASSLLKVQLGGLDRFDIQGSVGRTIVKAPDPNIQGFLIVAGSSNNIASFGTGNANYPAVAVRSTDAFGWSTNSDSASGSYDLFLTRRAAANLRLGAADTTGTTAPTPQFLSAQSWASSTTDNQTGADFTIDGSQGTGTGAGGSIIFRVAPAGGTSNGVQNALADALTINSARLAVFSGDVGLYSSNSLRIGSSSVNWQISASTTNITQSSANYYGFYDGTNLASGGSIDVRLYRDAANTLALRNGANAQTFRVYNTYTSATDFERANIFWDTNVLKIGTEKGSAGGTARALELQTDGVTRLTISTAGNATVTGWLKTNLYFDAPAAALGGNGGVYFGVTGTGAQIQATAVGVIAIANFAGSDFNRLQFGGTSASFPALKRSTTVLQAVLADDTGFATIQGKLRADVNAVAETPVATHTITITDAAGTAYKVLCVAA